MRNWVAGSSPFSFSWADHSRWLIGLCVDKVTCEHHTHLHQSSLVIRRTILWICTMTDQCHNPSHPYPHPSHPQLPPTMPLRHWETSSIWATVIRYCFQILSKFCGGEGGGTQEENVKLEKYTKIDERSFKSFDTSDPHGKMWARPLGLGALADVCCQWKGGGAWVGWVQWKVEVIMRIIVTQCPTFHIEWVHEALH